jgi:hypothetical protein
MKLSGVTEVAWTVKSHIQPSFFRRCSHGWGQRGKSRRKRKGNTMSPEKTQQTTGVRQDHLRTGARRRAPRGRGRRAEEALARGGAWLRGGTGARRRVVARKHGRAAAHTEGARAARQGGTDAAARGRGGWGRDDAWWRGGRARDDVWSRRHDAAARGRGGKGGAARGGEGAGGRGKGE